MDNTLHTHVSRSLAIDIGDNVMRCLTYAGAQAPELRTLDIDKAEGNRLRALENTVYDNPFLLDEYGQVTIALHSEHFSLMPQALVDEKLGEKVFEASFSKVEGELMQCLVKDTNAAVVCDVPLGVVAFLKRSFANPLIVHHLAPLCTYCAHAYADDSRCMHINIDGQQANVAIADAGKLQFANTFFFRTMDDLVYYIMNVWTTCGLDVRSDKVLLSGDRQSIDELAVNLRKLVSYAMPEVFPAHALTVVGREAINFPFNMIMLALYENY